MRVYISYSPGSSIVYCFWKYFFRSCGVWVTSEKIGRDWQIDKNKRPQLVILDKKTWMKYEAPSPNIVYCVKAKGSADQIRKDLIFVNQWENMYYSVIRQLFEGDENQSSFMELIGIFGGKYDFPSGKIIEEGLWSAVWLFHEIAQQAGNKIWDREICEKAKEAIDALHRAKKYTWHNEYMRLYCQYLQCGVNRSSAERMSACTNLLERCGSLSGREWNPSLAFLAGKVSLLTSTENKYAVFYFNEISKYDLQTDILYDIGHIYETAYGEYSTALKYYQKAYKLDNDYYRALYKFAVKLENEDDWRGAISVYSDVRQIIHKVKLKNDIGVRDLEYEYKSCRKMLGLCSKYLNDPDVEEALQNHIEAMHQDPGKYISFKKLFKIMFIKENRQKKEAEMSDVLLMKLDTVCNN